MNIARPGDRSRVLLMFQHQETAADVERALSAGMFVARATCNIGEFDRLLIEWNPHLVIVELSVHGLLSHVTAVIGQQGRKLPVVAVTESGDSRTRLGAYMLGANEVLALPLPTDEFIARLSSVLRLAYASAPDTTHVFRVGDLEMDSLSRRVLVSGRPVRLTTTEYVLLRLLMEHAGQALSRDDILNRVWGPGSEPDSNLVDRHIMNLRVKLGESGRRPRYIRTVPGMGYMFAEDGKD